MPPETIFSSDSDFEINQPLARTTIKSRRNSAEPKYYCTVDGCNQIFRRMDQLDRHEYHHTGIKKHHCLHEGCDKTYSILTHLKRHIRSTHERTEPVPKNVACTVKDCGQMFRSTCNMQRHIREVHENPKVYKCAHCSEQFTQKLKMRRHEITKHTGEFPFNCSKCGKGFYQQYHYDRHLPLCKIYPCPGCELKFEKWSLYRKHCRDTQHGRTYYNCEQCEKIFGKPAELERHMLTVHMDEGDKKLEFKCTADGCQRAYAHERNLKQHVRVAHGGTKFACKEPECTREFSSAQNLRKHVERDHSGVKSEVATAKLHKVVKARLKRKDAGQPAMSHLARMSNIAVDKETDKMLRAREVETLKDVSSLLSQVMSTTEDEDDNLSTKGGAKRATPTRN